MLEIFFGIIAGIISSMGMRRGNNFNILPNSIFKHKPTYSSSGKLSVLYSK